MADKSLTTLASGASTVLTGLTEHGSVVLGYSGNPSLKVEQKVADSPVVYEAIAPDPKRVYNYVGTVLRITNEGQSLIYLRVGQRA